MDGRRFGATPRSQRATLVAWSRCALVALALLFFAGITAKVVATGSAPFGWSGHWSVDATYGRALQALAYALWVPAVLGRLGRRFVAGAGLVAVAFPAGGQTLNLVTALALVGLPLWLALRTLDRVRAPADAAAPAAA